MARWAFLTVMLYTVLVAVLLIPAVCLCVDRIAGETTSVSEVLEAYSYWPFWALCATVLAVQALLLLFPVAKARGRPAAGISIWVTVITTAVLYSVLHLSIVASLAAAIWGDEMEGWGPAMFWVIGFIVAGWALWASVFYRFSRREGQEAFLENLVAWLLRGSIVELLIAVPCHVIVRHKDTCCAPGLTFFGISAGLAIMALAFGPGLFFLVARRIREISPKDSSAVTGG